MVKVFLICEISEFESKINALYYHAMNKSLRYQRQTALPEIGTHGQTKLQQAKVLVVGAGGLGCAALQYLAAAGIGTLGIVDDDVVDESNLQRQVLYKNSDIGKQKALRAKEYLQELNPDIMLHAFTTRLTAENALNLFQGYDIVLDATDNFSAKFLINDAAIKSGKRVVYGAINGFEGYAAVFGAKTFACYRCLHPTPPTASVQNCAEAGVIGALAGIVGSVQAFETIKLIVADPSFEMLEGRLWVFDAKNMTSQTLRINQKENCISCSNPTNTIVLEQSTACGMPPVQEITWHDLRTEDVLIDVREQHEWDQGHVAGAHHLPLSKLNADINLFQHDTTATRCVFYCQRGLRSRAAVERLLAAGHKNICSLTGGYAIYRAA